MKQRSALSIIVLFLTTLAVGPAALLAKELPTDSRVLTGRLDNGVTWMYRRHDNPPGKMALMMHVDSGSLNETEKQRGLAHFIEHMCFNGTENFPPGELIPYFESIGMEFGPDLNAFTSFDQTAYMLFTPNTEAEQIDKALTVLSDYAFRVLLLEEEIDKERGVILEEARAGKNANQRVRDKLWPELFEGTRIAKRLPIGLEEVIANAPREVFVDYYRTWYRPENVTVVLVGDADHEGIVPLIEKRFGRYEAPVPAREQKGPEFKPFTEQRGLVVTDPELARCRIQMYNVRPGRPSTTTEKLWRTELVESVAGWIMDRRFDDLVNKGEASFRTANAGVGNFFNDALLITGMAMGEPDEWSDMLEQLVTEVKRAREHGFTLRELGLAKKELLAGAKRAVRTEPTRNARGFAFQIISAVNEEEPILSAEQELDLHEKMLPTITLDEVNAVMKKHFTPGTFAYVVTTPDKPGVPVPERDEVLAMARSAWAREVEALREDEAVTQLLPELPDPGKVVESSMDEDLKITSGWLSNGVRFHHRFMDYKKDQVLVTISLAGGQIEETAENAGITEVATLAVREAATSRLTSTQMRDLMTGKNINVFGSASDDAFGITVTGSPEDLEAGMQQVYALLTDGKIEEAAFKNWKLNMLQRIAQLEKMPRFQAMVATSDLLSGGDPRRTYWTRERVKGQSRSEAQAWFERLCREAPIEVSVVGDISLEKVRPLLTRYLGSLPERSRTADHLASLRHLDRPAGPLSRRMEVETMTPQAMAIAGFVGCDVRHVTDRRALEVCSNVLSSRLIKRIREELSLVYSIGAQNAPSDAYVDAGVFLAAAPCDPEKVETLVDEVRTIFNDFAEKGPTEEELANAKRQIAENLDNEMKEPGYWSGVLRALDLHGRALAEQKREKSAFEKLTGEQVRDVFRAYNKPEQRFKVIAVPAQPETEAKEPEAAAAS